MTDKKYRLHFDQKNKLKNSQESVGLQFDREAKSTSHLHFNQQKQEAKLHFGDDDAQVETVSGSLIATAGSVSVSGTGIYDANTFRGLRDCLSQKIKPARDIHQTQPVLMHTGQGVRACVRSPFEPAKTVVNMRALRVNRHVSALASCKTTHWQPARTVHYAQAVLAVDAYHLVHQARASNWQFGRAVRGCWATDYDFVNTARVCYHFENIPIQAVKACVAQGHKSPAQNLSLCTRSKFERATWPVFGYVVPPHPDPPDAPTPYQHEGVLWFNCPLTRHPPDLWFGYDVCADVSKIVVPVQKVYVVLNNAVLKRVNDNAVIPCASLSMSIDAGSWAWSLSATLHGDDADQLVRSSNGQSVEVACEVNGYTWLFLIDTRRKSRAFNQVTTTISGRSLSAYLSAPYQREKSYLETQARTAHQLMQRELPNGWSLDYQMVDWLVPAGVWSYQNKSPMQAMAEIAKAGGGYVQADRQSKIIHAHSGYKHKPWEWSGKTPDIQIPRDVMWQASSDDVVIDEANIVRVMGQSSGVLGEVKREGTAGDKPAPDVVDKLITHADVARARGITELAKARAHSKESFEMPLSQSLGGLVGVGALVEVTRDGVSQNQSWRAQCNGVSVACSYSSSNGLVVTQTINLERHYG